MTPTPVYFKDGALFAYDYVRVVKGARGSYVEFTREQIAVTLVSRFNQELPSVLPTHEAFYYYWMEPLDRSEKVYWQNRNVKYADYKVGLFYVDPNLLIFESKNSLLKEC